MIRPAILHLLLALTGCTNGESTRIDETRSKLQGTWLAAPAEGAPQPRHVLVLAADGKFLDRVSFTTAAGTPERVEYGGEWSYDGTNLKRRYLHEGGRQFSGGKIRYATFPLVSVSASELVLDDNIRHEKVTLRRVADDTQP